MKKFALILLIMILFSMLIADGTPAEGSGTENDPYLIETLDNLLWLSTNEDVWVANTNFLQTADIDASDTQSWNDGAGFSPIGIDIDMAFMGNYDGGIYIIDSLYINRPDQNYVGLFGYATGSLLDSIGLYNINIIGNEYTGGLAGENRNSSISNSCVTGNVTGNDNVGGLVGRNGSSHSINSCHSSCIVTGINLIGGLCGIVIGSTISNCNASGSVTGEFAIGGLIGSNSRSTLNECYFSGNVTGEISAGGLIGSNYMNSVISESYYNYENTLINGQSLITIGAMDSEFYDSWLSNSMNLEIDDYLSNDGENYLINNSNDFEKLMAFGQNSELSFLLTEDIDLSDKSDFFIPYFSGTFKGNNHIISGLNVNNPFAGSLGLFGYTYEAVIEDLGVTEINLTGFNLVGGLVGFCYSSSLNSNYITGSVTGSGDIGGMTGSNYYSIISNSYSTCHVTGNSRTGGLTGLNENSIIQKSYASGAVTSTHLVGGLAGDNYCNSSIIDCYATGDVNGEVWAGGLVGHNHFNTSIITSYSTGYVNGIEFVGGLTGKNNDEALINSCFWDIETSNQNTGVGENDGGNITELIGATTAEMQQMSTFTDIGWDFVGESVNGTEDIWNIDEETNEGYPFIYDIEYPVGNDEEVIENVKLNTFNYPNPFNPETTIYFYTTNLRQGYGTAGRSTKDAEINIYNVKGQFVRRLRIKDEGLRIKSVIWDGKDDRGHSCVSGIYFYQIKADESIGTGKMLMLK